MSYHQHAPGRPSLVVLIPKAPDTRPRALTKTSKGRGGLERLPASTTHDSMTSTVQGGSEKALFHITTALVPHAARDNIAIPMASLIAYHLVQRWPSLIAINTLPAIELGGDVIELIGRVLDPENTRVDIIAKTLSDAALG